MAAAARARRRELRSAGRGHTVHRRAFVPGQLLVEFRAGVSGAALRTAARGAGSVISRRLPGSAAAPGRTLVL